MKLTFTSLLLPLLGHAAPLRANDLSTLSSSASSTNAGPTTPPTLDSPCKGVRLAMQASKDLEPPSRGTVPAKLAYECLNSIPFNQSDALTLLASMRPYLEWQSTTALLKDPPKEYAEKVQPPYDFWATFNAIEANVADGAYASEYDFGWDLYLSSQLAHDGGHFVYIPRVLTFFAFGRTTPLVSVSEDGKDLPVVYAYSDILATQACSCNSSFTPSHIVQIDGRNTTEFLLEMSQDSGFTDRDAKWNSLFYSNARALGSSGDTGMFSSGDRGPIVYPGPTTTLTFANGTNITNENRARPLIPLEKIESGADIYKNHLISQPEAYLNVFEGLQHEKEFGGKDKEKDNDMLLPRFQPERITHFAKLDDDALEGQTKTMAAPGYPSPVIRHQQNLNGGYFLEEPGFEDVAVLAVGSFVGAIYAGREFKKVNSDFIAAALAANKTKLIIDVSANGGGTIMQGYDLFKQLFPNIHPYGATRFRAHESADWIGEVYSNTSYSPEHPVLIPWDYRTDLDSEDQPWPSWNEKYGPHHFGNDSYSSLIRWNLNDPMMIQHTGGIDVSGYGPDSNASTRNEQPFKTENIILVYDGVCASTCAIFSEFLRQEAGIKTIALGGRPSTSPMQGVGGVKGTSVFTWSYIWNTVAQTIIWAKDKHQLESTVLAQYTKLPLARFTAASVNFRDGIRRGDGMQIPYQFLYEPTECRIFYTKPMVVDQAAVWKTVADTVWGKANACIAGSDHFYGNKDMRGGGKTPSLPGEGYRVWGVRSDFDVEGAWEALEVQHTPEWERYKREDWAM
ncbi:hypothetical protein E4T48_00085 [Aureobasidium sp. EXF-10727]|nr:hypothetical protein E4T48_00085 [Aureobasidium sp. EXF-10727]